jgi:hypothetical protein
VTGPFYALGTTWDSTFGKVSYDSIRVFMNHLFLYLSAGPDKKNGHKQSNRQRFTDQGRSTRIKRGGRRAEGCFLHSFFLFPTQKKLSMKKKKKFFLMWSSSTSSARHVAEPCQFFFHMSVTFFNLGKKGGFSRPKKTKKKEA